MPYATAIVFVVDDDVSVRESLELLISCAGWQPETFASAQEFLVRPRIPVPSCLVLDVSLPGLNGLDLQTCCWRLYGTPLRAVMLRSDAKQRSRHCAPAMRHSPAGNGRL